MSKNAKQSLLRIRESLINYLFQKQQSEDWHGVADAAMDLREVDAKLEIIEEYERETKTHS
jgi:hypothetical protein